MQYDLVSEIDETVRTRMENRKWAGLALGIQQGDDVQAHCYGYANLEHRVDVHEDSVFAIGSVTKQFTAALVLCLAEREALSVDDEITVHLPNYPVGNRCVTIHHLLTHTSGIQTYSAIPEFRKRYGEALSPEEIADIFKDEPFQSEPGERFDYNNSGYHLLGMIIEKVVGKPYSECLAQYLFEPSGLQHTRYFANAPVIPDRATGYIVETGVVRNAPYLSMHLPYAAGAIGSTVGDMLKWQRLLNEHEILTEASLRLMRRPASLVSGETTQYGYGVAIATFEGQEKLTHDGGIPGFTATLSHYPAHDLTITVMINMGFANPWAVDSEIARLVLALPSPARPPITLSSEELGIYAGRYVLGSQEIEISVVRDELDWLGQRFHPIGNHVFQCIDDPECSFTFTTNSTGIAKAVRSRDGIETPMQRAGGKS